MYILEIQFTNFRSPKRFWYNKHRDFYQSVTRFLESGMLVLYVDRGELLREANKGNGDYIVKLLSGGNNPLTN